MLLVALFSCGSGDTHSAMSDPFSKTPVEGLTFEALTNKLSVMALLEKEGSFAVTTDWGDGEKSCCGFKKDGEKTLGYSEADASYARIFDGTSVLYVQNKGLLYTVMHFGTDYAQVVSDAFLYNVRLSALDEENTGFGTNLLDDSTAEARCTFYASTLWADYLSGGDTSVKRNDYISVYIELDAELYITAITYSRVSDSGAYEKLMTQSFSYGTQLTYPETKLDWQNAERFTVTVTDLDSDDAASETFSVPSGSRITNDIYDTDSSEIYFFTDKYNILPYFLNTDEFIVKADTEVFISKTCG